MLGSIAGEPHCFSDIIVGQLIVDAVAGEDDEVVLLSDLERSDVGHRFDHVRVAATVLQFCLRVAKCSTDGQAARQDADGTDYKLGVRRLFRRGRFLLLLRRLVITVFIVIQGLGGGGLIDLPASLYDSLVLFDVAGFVVAAQRSHLQASVRREDGPAVAYVRYVADLTDDQHYDRA